jgi:hypothetical protein
LESGTGWADNGELNQLGARAQVQSILARSRRNRMAESLNFA